MMSIFFRSCGRMLCNVGDQVSVPRGLKYMARALDTECRLAAGDIEIKQIFLTLVGIR